MEKMIKLVYPTYLNQFKCVGGTCEDSCCIGWNVEIDRITYRQYFRTKDHEMLDLFKKYVYKNEEAYSADVDYGKVRLTDTLHCPFLDDDHYCKIYSTLGESYLSNICTSYPRVTNAIDDLYEVSLYVSCPEAARLILLNPEGIKFQETTQALGKHILGSVVDTRLKVYQQSPIKYFKEIREKCIQLMQNRKYTLTDRLLLLGYFLEALDEKADISQKAMLSHLKAFSPDQLSNLTSPSTNFPLQIRLFNQWLADLEINPEIESKNFVQLTKIAQKAFKFDASVDIMQQAALFEASIKNLVDPFIQEHAYIFENDLVNFMFRTVFPFSETHFMFDGYMMLLIHYIWIRFYLAGVFQDKEKASVEDAVHVMQVLAKTLDHHNTFLDALFEDLKENEYDHMAFAKDLL